MPNISIEVIAAIGFAILVVLSLLMKRRRPKEQTFKCARCSTIADHTPRTIEAWRSGKTRFFCNACHAQWLRSHPSPISSRSEKSGCLGVVAFFVAIPFLLIASWWGYV
ncbi:hypothetical protein [Allochromatium vinosum]|uniref:hypothetical protein n=1 Tax=Allochromatium vinosum TaxID=1049 RepID=UPI001908AECC|nr:hypothetical protein [Allochromatium vinosum]